MKHELAIETRSAVPIETRAEGDGDDSLAAVTAAVTEIRTAQEAFQTRTDQQLETDLAALRTRLDAIDTRSQRPGAGGGTERTDEAVQLQTRAFDNFVRYGREAMEPVEVRALVSASDVKGGVLAPPEFERELIKEIIELNPIREAATVKTTSSGEVVIPTVTNNQLDPEWVGETEDRTEGDVDFGDADIPIHEMARYIDVSNWLLEDAVVDVEAEFRTLFAEKFAYAESVAFVEGNGVKKPVGIMTDARVGYVANGHATVLNPDKLISLMYSLPAFYRKRGSFLLNGSTIAVVRLFKDTTNRYLWQESLAEGQPPTLLGRPVLEAIDMDDVGSDAFPIAYGDFASAFRIYDRLGLTILRDPYTQATKGKTRFHARRRVGAAVVRPTAIKKLKMATS